MDVARLSTASNLRVPAIHNHEGYGRWGFVEVADPWDARRTIRAAMGSPSAARPTTADSPIRKTPGVCGGDACIRATRIPVWTLVAYRNLGADDGELIADFPGLTAGDLAEAWRYERDHADEIARAIRDNEDA